MSKCRIQSNYKFKCKNTIYHKRNKKKHWYMDADILAEKMKVYGTIESIKGGIFDNSIQVTVKGRKK